jgi:esterase/lipase superfamily enzyme
MTAPGRQRETATGRATGSKIAMRRPVVISVVSACLLVGCANRPYGDLVIAPTSAPGADVVHILAATTRAPVIDPPGVIFGGERGRGLNFADIAVSVPPDSARKIGEVQWPASPPGDPAKDFVTLSLDRLPLAQAKARFDARVAATPGRKVLVFVHGYNTRFEEAVYRFAQIVHDSHADVTPALFTWPSRGRVFDYVYDRDSAIYSRDAFEAVLEGLDKDPAVGSISILAHSMGNYLTVEALRQMTIRNRGLPAKLDDVMLASPDIDLDVFRRQIAEIDAAAHVPTFTLFVSRDDRALGFAQFIAGDRPRLGEVDPTEEPMRSILEQAKVHVVDLTAVEANDANNHNKFATKDVVAAIGARLATGQSLTDSKAGLAETLSGFAKGTANLVGGAAALTLTAPINLIDPAKKETSVDAIDATPLSSDILPAN